MNYKEMFEHWYDNQNDAVIEFKEHGNCDSWKLISLKDFYKLPPAMQQGVKREFFESKGILIEVFTSKPKLTFGYKVVNEGGDLLDDGFPDYNTAFNTAIETAGKVLEWVK